MTIITKNKKSRLRDVASRIAFALVLLGLGGTLLIGASQAQEGTVRIVSTPIAKRFVEGVSKAFNGASIEITEMNSVPALELMCAGMNAAKPDLVLSATTIMPSIADQCVANGISVLTEAQLGFLTLVLVQKSSDTPFMLTPRDLYLALASDVPSDDGFTVNKSRYWADVNPKLPALAIRMVLAPRPGVTRSIFEANALVAGCRKYDVIQNIYEAAPRTAKCTDMREEVIEEVDDAILRVEALRNSEPGAVALVTYDIYDENRDWLRVMPFDGFMPTSEDVIREDYLLTAPIYVYTRPELVTGDASNAVGRAWLIEALSENAVGDDGYLKAIGLTVLPKVTREWQRRALGE